jgi:acyl carrier protein
MIEKTAAEEIVIKSLREAIEQAGIAVPAHLDAETVLVGKGAVLDSLGVVSLIVEIEQRVEADHGVSVTLANDKAMSQRNSPFRTVGVLTEHLLALVAEVSAS